MADLAFDLFGARQFISRAPVDPDARILDNAPFPWPPKTREAPCYSERPDAEQSSDFRQLFFAGTCIGHSYGRCWSSGKQSTSQLLILRRWQGQV